MIEQLLTNLLTVLLQLTLLSSSQLELSDLCLFDKHFI